MEKPTVDELLDRIETKAMRPEWFDGRTFQMFRDGNKLWYRHPEGEMVLRVTVEEVLRTEWPEIGFP